MTALTRYERPISVLDWVFGDNNFGMIPFVGSKATHFSNVAESIDADGYMAQVTVPDGFNLDEIKAEMEGNILRVRVPRIQAETKSIEVAKLETTEGS